jgi:hypothetical protein
MNSVTVNKKLVLLSSEGFHTNVCDYQPFIRLQCVGYVQKSYDNFDTAET